MHAVKESGINHSGWQICKKMGCTNQFFVGFGSVADKHERRLGWHFLLAAGAA